MLDLYNNKYDMKTLKLNIYTLNMDDILKTQTLDVKFVVKYILNPNYQFTEAEQNINILDVLKYQPHINKKLLISEFQKYSDDDDSIVFTCC
jgi:hypothetical protein